MPGTRCINCRWWNGDHEYAPTSVFENKRHGGCERIVASPALRDDTAARLLPVGTSAWVSTRFDFSCASWEKRAGAKIDNG